MDKEPHLGQFFAANPDYVPKANAPADPRADIAVADTPVGHAVYDLVISAPHVPLPGNTLPHKLPTPGQAATQAYNAKMNLASARFLRTGGHFFPLSIESAGRWHPASRLHLATYIQWCIGKDPKDFDANDKVFYTRSIRDGLDSASLALVRHQARQLLAAVPGGRSA
jgi:hypothetical protein